jgi:hypothetical protein
MIMNDVLSDVHSVLLYHALRIMRCPVNRSFKGKGDPGIIHGNEKKKRGNQGTQICFDMISGYTTHRGTSMAEDEENKILSKREMYALLLKEYEECRDEGRECYLEELIEELRKDLESA